MHMGYGVSGWGGGSRYGYGCEDCGSRGARDRAVVSRIGRGGGRRDDDDTVADDRRHRSAAPVAIFRRQGTWRVS